MTHMKLECPNCGASVPATNINVQETIAVCPACDTVFNFSGGDVNVGSSAMQATKPKNKFKYDEVRMPNSFDVQETDQKLTISYSWFSCIAPFLTFFALVWNGIIFGIFFPAISGFNNLGFPFAFFPLIFGGVGVGLVYFNIAQYVNRTYIVIGPKEMQIYSKPLPMPNTQTIKHDEIHQVYAKQRINRNSDGKRTITYEVQAAMHGNQHKKLVGSLSNAEQALFIEQEIEKYLGIDDVRVSGEYRTRAY